MITYLTGHFGNIEVCDAPSKNRKLTAPKKKKK